MTSDTKTCDACGKRYAFTSYKDRCPVCCPVEDKDSESSEEYDQTDFSNRPSVSGIVRAGCTPIKKGDPKAAM
jgi:hypothetical protein